MMARRLVRGDIVLATIPFTNLAAAKLRPALVVSPGLLGTDVVLVAISSVVRADATGFDIVFDAKEPAFAQSGLLRTSVFRTHHIVTVQDRIIARYLGQLTSPWLARVDEQLRRAVGLALT